MTVRTQTQYDGRGLSSDGFLTSHSSLEDKDKDKDKDKGEGFHGRVVWSMGIHQLICKIW